MIEETSLHEAMMARALALALAADYRVSPNPLVAALCVQNGVILGQGITRKPGQAHAEIVALREAGEAARGADLYVTLEPCCHFGRTPPCTDAIIAAGIRRVFVGTLDPNPRVHSMGAERLRAAGIEVHVGILEEACARWFAPFARFMSSARPFITLKAAVTLDGKIACASGNSCWITGASARKDVHGMRARCDGVLVGIGTALYDDPRLDVRDAPGENPARILLDAHLRLPPTARLLGPETLIYCAPDASPEKAQLLEQTGAQVVRVAGDEKGICLQEVVNDLGRRGMVQILVEGGSAVHGSFLRSRLADALCFYVAPRLIGSGKPVTDLHSALIVASGISLEDVQTAVFDCDVRICGRIKYPEEGSDVYRVD